MEWVIFLIYSLAIGMSGAFIGIAFREGRRTKALKKAIEQWEKEQNGRS